MQSQSGEPIVLNQSRSAYVKAALLGAASLLFGLTPHHHRYVYFLIPAEWIMIPGGFFFLSMGLFGVAGPGRLTLSPAGIKYEILMFTKSASWESLRSIDFWSMVRRPVWTLSKPSQTRRMGLTLRLSGGKKISIGGSWPYSPEDLAALILKSQQQWSSAPPAQYNAAATTLYSGFGGTERAP